MSYHLILLAKNELGYKNLLKLTSISYLEGFYYRPRIDKDDLEKYSEGLICTSACIGGSFQDLFWPIDLKMPRMKFFGLKSFWQ